MSTSLPQLQGHPPPSMADRSEQWFLALILLLLIPVLFYGLGDRPIHNSVEERVVVTAREMSRTGDWIVPTMNGVIRLQKPPLAYWLVQAAACGEALRAAWTPWILLLFVPLMRLLRRFLAALRSEAPGERGEHGTARNGTSPLAGMIRSWFLTPLLFLALIPEKKIDYLVPLPDSDIRLMKVSELSLFVAGDTASDSILAGPSASEFRGPLADYVLVDVLDRKNPKARRRVAVLARRSGS